MERESFETYLRKAAEAYRGAKQPRSEVDLATEELEEYMKTSEGQAAMELLAASNRRIKFGEESGDGGYRALYFMDGEGLKKSSSTVSVSALYSMKSCEVFEPEITTITARQAVEVAIRYYPNLEAKDIVGFLKVELDPIARGAPGNTRP